MKKLISLFILTIFISCTNLRHATNINFRDLRSISHDENLQKKLNKDIQEISPTETKKCKFIKEYIARDNIQDIGEKYAVLYLKYEAYKLKANAVFIKEKIKIGDYGYKVLGEIFICPK